MQSEKYIRSNAGNIADYLKSDFDSIKGVVIAVFAGLLLMYAGFQALPEESTPLLAKVMCLLSLTIATAGVGAYAGRRLTGLLPAIGLLILSIIGMFIIRSAGGGFAATGLLMGWGFINGMMLGPLVAFAVSEEGPGIVLQALTGTTAVMLVTGVIAMATGINFSFLMPLLLIALIGLIVVGLVRIFVKFSRTVNLVYSGIGMLVFSGFFLLNFFRISRSENTWERAVDSTISLYLSFANFFTMLLQFMLSSRRR
ncbi:MAG: Bax inhibitor-1/YccA family protein [Acidobacteria bacterium]|nr:Bax inhibitor-1/YccA family protein [Acidobacteriota bacterium]